MILKKRSSTKGAIHPWIHRGGSIGSRGSCQHAHGADVPRLGSTPRGRGTSRSLFISAALDGADRQVLCEVSRATQHRGSECFVAETPTTGVRVLSRGFLSPPGPSRIVVPDLRNPRRVCTEKTGTFRHGADNASWAPERAELRCPASHHELRRREDPCEVPRHHSQGDSGDDYPKADGAIEEESQSRPTRPRAAPGRANPLA